MTVTRAILAIIALLVLCALVWSASMLGSNIPLAEQASIYEGLRDAASIIFGVAGAWIALVYPNAIASFMRRDSTTPPAEYAAMKRLVPPILISTCIIAVVLLLAILGPLLRQSDWLLERRDHVRAASFVLVCVLTIAEIVAVIHCLAPLDHVERELRKLHLKNKAIAASRPNAPPASDSVKQE